MSWKISNLKPHKLNADVFDDLNPRHLKQLMNDIDERGLQQPLEIKSDGTIITGHQRWKALKELYGEDYIIPHDLIRIRTDIEDDEDKVVEELVLDNVLRRQLNDFQIANAYGFLKKIYEGRHGGDRKSKEFQGVSFDTLKEEGKSIDIIAKKFGITKNTLKNKVIAIEVDDDEEKEERKKGKTTKTVKKKVQKELQKRSLAAKKDANKRRKDKVKEDSSDFVVHFDSSEKMKELDASIQLVVTSPPYWNLKEYGGGEEVWLYSDYLITMKRVWRESLRVLQDGCRLCINVGDVYLPTTKEKPHQTVPIHADFISQCIDIGFMYMGLIIWQKVATAMPSGGGTFMGSYPFPRDGMITPDYEYILIFKKPGKNGRKPSDDEKELSKMNVTEWSKYFQGHWNFPGQKQESHCAEFPLELPLRLIKMFSFVGDTVLDPFLGSGTTLKAAKQLQRKGIGYEKQEKFKVLIEEKVGIQIE